MDKNKKRSLKKKVMENFIKLIESKEELKNDPELKQVYQDLKKKLMEEKV